MKVICNRGALLEALMVTGNAVQARTPKPVLLCVKLTAADDRLTIAATDLEVAIRYSDTQVQIEEPGEALLPADKFRDIVRESIDDTLSIEITGDSAHIKGQDSHFKIFTQSASEFPPVPDFEGEADFEVPIWEFGLNDQAAISVTDLMRGEGFMWYGKIQRIRLDPVDLPFRIWRLEAR